VDIEGIEIFDNNGYLEFEKLKFANVDWVQSGPTRHPATFCCNTSNGCGDMAF